MGVVKLAHTLGPRFLQLLQRRPFEQELTAQWGEEILAGQLQRLRIITFEGIAQHVGKKSAQIDQTAARFQQARELPCRSIIAQPGSEFLPVMQQ